MRKSREEIDKLFADLDASGDLVDLDARQTEALRKAAERRKEARRADHG